MNGRAGRADKRGNSRDRAARRVWLLLAFDVDLGADRARCHLRLSAFCEREVDATTLSVDRKEMGGTYARHNIQPACTPCQNRQGGLANVATMDALLTEYRYAREQWELRFETATNMTYRPRIIERELRKADRGGRNEVYDFVEQDPPPMFRDWLAEWHASRREPCEDAAGAAASSWPM